jgi:nitroimidazol reductase NimA-like FMN-containing flavoprotein (pyridoxamine 5'-phosphate oxidase superfamily)
MDSHAPVIRELPPDVARALLARHHVGRLAFAFHDRVDVEPIHFAMPQGRVFFRTAPGSKLTTLRHNRWVALEVDEVEGLFTWRSAVAHGTVYELHFDGPEVERAAYRLALDALRDLVPGTMRRGDPVPHRDVIIELRIDRITGREASPQPPLPPPGGW